MLHSDALCTRVVIGAELPSDTRLLNRQILGNYISTLIAESQ